MNVLGCIDIILGSFSWREKAWTYSVLDETFLDKFQLIESWMIFYLFIEQLHIHKECVLPAATRNSL